VCAKLYDRKTPITAADLLNDRVLPLFEQHDAKLLRSGVRISSGAPIKSKTYNGFSTDATTMLLSKVHNQVHDRA
jgi:hypothetical protein